MNRHASRPDDLTPEAMAARLAPHIERQAAVRSTAKDVLRAQFPLMAELVDQFRDAGMSPRPVHAINASGDEWGRAPDDRLGVVVDGDKLAHLTEYQLFWQRFYGKKAETNATYRERMQRAIKPSTGTV